MKRYIHIALNCLVCFFKCCERSLRILQGIAGTKKKKNGFIVSGLFQHFFDVTVLSVVSNPPLVHSYSSVQFLHNEGQNGGCQRKANSQLRQCVPINTVTAKQRDGGSSRGRHSSGTVDAIGHLFL